MVSVCEYLTEKYSVVESCCKRIAVKMVPRAGLEPARLSPLPPQDSVSTKSTTWALIADPVVVDVRDAHLQLQLGTAHRRATVARHDGYCITGRSFVVE